MRAWLQQLAELRKILVFLRPYLVRRPLMLVGVLVTSLFVMLFEGFGVGLLVPLLNLLLGGERATPMRPLQWLEAAVPGHSPAFYVGAIAVGVVASIALKNVFYYSSLILTSKLKRQVSIALRGDLFRQLHRADLDLFDRMPGGDLANVFLVETFRTTLAVDGLLQVLQRSSIAIFYALALCYLSLPLTFIVAVLAVSLGVALQFVYARLKRAGIELTELNHRLSATLGQSFAGIRIVRATHSQAREIEQFRAVNTAQADAELKSAENLSLVFPITETLAVAGAMVIVMLAYIFLVRPGFMLGSYLLAYGFILLRLLPLLNQLYQQHAHLAYLAGGINEVESWLSTPQFPTRPFGPKTFNGLARELRFEQVGYKYPNGRVALEEIDFSVPFGQTAAIVGPSGAGKSTLANILLRFRATSSGRILVDGEDCWEFTPESWHRSIALVEQDAFLFHGTLRENILYGCDRVDEQALANAIADAHLTDVIAGLPDGLETLVGERGAMVSGGQRQRIAIARALIRNPSILILDEATSHLDAVSERLVQQALQNASRGRTTLVIAHRLSTIREADLLVVLENGRIAEKGTWDSLATSGGVFQRLIQGMDT